MKQGWEIKKLGEVCNVINGLWVGKKEPFINIAVIRNTNFSKDCQLQLDNVAFIDVEVKQFSTRKLLQGDIIIEKSGGSDKQPVGRVVLFNIIDGNYSFSNFTSVLRIKSTVPLIPNFLHKCLYEYYIKGETIKLQSKTTGLRNLNMHAYLRLNIPVPPLSEQERIVAELDLLSDVIAKKREQLKQLDTLAQSIFYDMFGDPITNEKGWKTKKLGETSTLHNGRAFKPTDWSNSGLPIVRIQNLNNPTLPFNYYDGEVANNHRLYGGELLYAWSGTPDTSFVAHIWYGGDAVLNQHIFKIEYNKDLLNIKYFVFNLNGIVNSMFDKTHGGVGLQHITKGTLTSQNICLPPLYLQQQFASKIEAIEKQKELIKQSLSEVQQLFDSRMDYYFG